MHLPGIFDRDQRIVFLIAVTDCSRTESVSSIGGDLISTAIAETYYPEANRGPGAFAGTFL